MNHRRRLAAGAAVAGALVTAPAALADANPNPAGALSGSTPVVPTTSVPLPAGIAQCLIQNGFPIPLPSTKVDLPAPSTKVALPATAGALPAAFTDTIPLPGIGVPSTTGTNPIPAEGGANSTGGVQCGQMIINNTMYMVLVNLTTTTTTTTTTAAGPIAAGPVTVTAPAAAPVVRAPVATGNKRQTHRRARRKHSAHYRPLREKRALQIFLYRKSPGHGARGA